jgi:hypothetical protein
MLAMLQIESASVCWCREACESAPIPETGGPIVQPGLRSYFSAEMAPLNRSCNSTAMSDRCSPHRNHSNPQPPGFGLRQKGIGLGFNLAPPLSSGENEGDWLSLTFFEAAIGVQQRLAPRVARADDLRAISTPVVEILPM